MRNPIAQRRSRPQVSPAVRKSTICVVDPTLDDYRDWRSLAETSGVGIQIVSTAQQALHLAREHSIDLWVVNTNLPDLSGFELCGLIKGLSASTPVYMVADEYDPSAERAAWQARASVFGCKGAHAAWLEEWLKVRSRHRVATNASTTSHADAIASGQLGSELPARPRVTSIHRNENPSTI